MENRKLSKSWILAYIGKSFSTRSNGLDLMKTKHGTLLRTFYVFPTGYAPSMLTILNAWDHQRDLKNGYNCGRMVMMMLRLIQIMNMPKTEGSLGLRRGVIL